MKLIKETDRIYLYEDNQGELEIAIKTTDEDQIYDFYTQCDGCGAHSKVYYLCPELATHSRCDKCFREYRKRARWYQEDMHTIFNCLIIYAARPHQVALKDLQLTEEDLDLINQYFESHSNRRVDIRNFMRREDDECS